MGMSNAKGQRKGKSKQAPPTKPHRYYFFYSASSPFSNFHPSQFVDEDGKWFFCSEQYMMYHKAMLFEDCDIAKKILEEQNEPMTCKRLGRSVQNFDDEVWQANARRIVEDGLYLKFTQNPKLKRELLSTGDLEMVEAAGNDRRWGIGFNEKKAMQVPREKWGSNWLGQVLTIVRERIRREESGQRGSTREEG